MPTDSQLDQLRLAIVGLGYVGLPLAVEFGRIRPVIGFDIKSARIQELESGTDTTRETSAEELASAHHLRFSSDPAALREANCYIVTVPTPIDDYKRPDLSPLLKASETIGRVLKKGDIVIYESTVYPGCTEDDCVPVLEQHSGLVYNLDFFCGYSPERINPGDKAHRLANIKKVTSGSTPEIAALIDDLYAQIITAGTHLASSIKVAEAAKVIENTQRDLNIALINELSIIFARLGIDTLEVLEAAGSKWNFLPFRPGLVGGHCIGVDPYYLTHKAEGLGYSPQMILAGRRINDGMARHAARSVIRLMLRNGIDVTQGLIGVQGITFKENCPDIRNSKVIDLIRELEHWGARVVVADPWAEATEVRQTYGIELRSISPQHQVDSLIVAVSHREFLTQTPEQLRALCRGERPVIGDLKSIYDRHALAAQGLHVFRL